MTSDHLTPAESAAERIGESGEYLTKLQARSSIVSSAHGQMVKEEQLHFYWHHHRILHVDDRV